jgi:hypothetical protein
MTAQGAIHVLQTAEPVSLNVISITYSFLGSTQTYPTCIQFKLSGQKYNYTKCGQNLWLWSKKQNDCLGMGVNGRRGMESG